MRLNRKSKSAALLTGLIFAGCASFTPRLRYQDLMGERLPTVEQAQEGLTVSVEEFVSPTKSKQAFDADLAPYGVLALLARMENRGSATYRMPSQSIKVSLNNQPLSPLSGEQAATQAATSEYAGKALGWTVAAGPFALLLWPATIAGSAVHTQGVNARIIQHFESLEFTGSLVRPNLTAGGFVYFQLPQNVKTLENIRVEVIANEEQSGKRLPFNLQLPTLELSAAVSHRAVSENKTDP